jgi:iron complex outermembrane receptor protein
MRAVRRGVLLAGISALGLWDAARADDAPAGQVDEVIVTGTRTTTRTVTTSLAPIDVLSAEVLEKSGKQSTRDLISTFVPSATTSNSGAGASFAIKTVSLRGLQSDQVLVLVNGKRRHNTALIFVNGTVQNGQSPPDLDLIPSSAIKRIEVLRDGASAQYGSDALAGVINVILKDEEGGSFSALTGVTDKGDGETVQGALNYGFAMGAGKLNVTFDARTTNHADRGEHSAYPGVLYFPVNGQPDPRENTADRHTAHPGAPQQQLYSFGYNGSYALGPAELYSFGTASSRNSAAYLTFRPPNSLSNIVALYPDGYTPRLILKDRDWQFAVGGRGDLAGFHWDLSTNLSENEVEYYSNSLNASLGPASPTTFYLGALQFREWTSNLDLSREYDLGLSGPLFVAVGAEYRRDEFEIGAGQPQSYVNGGYRAPAGTPLAGQVTQGGAQGVTGFPRFAAGTFKRNNKSAYINLEQALTDQFEVALAGRFEHYSDFGDAETGKISARWEPIHGYALRATASTGFRAPSLQQEHYASSSTIGVNIPGQGVVLYPVQLLPPDNPAAIALGAKPLKPEKSTNYSAGLVAQPLSGMNVTVDVYQIKIRNRIIQSEQLGPNATVSAALASQGLNPQQAAFYYANAADTRTRGVDLVVDYRLDLGEWGALKTTVSANYNKTRFTKIVPPPPQLAAAGLLLVGRTRIGDFTSGTPRDKQILSLEYTRGAFSGTVRATRFGKVVTRNATNPALDEEVAPAGIVDLDFSYDVTEAIRVSLGANNLTGEYPDVVKPGNRGGANPFTWYNQNSPYGILGAFYYARVGVKF